MFSRFIYHTLLFFYEHNKFNLIINWIVHYMRIIVDIPDGLGNQLFGYVFGYTLLDMLFKRSWGVSGVFILLFKTAVLRGNCRLINKKRI